MMAPWISTYTRRRAHILNPRPEEIHILDIAHALSNTCRFAGHVPSFYSVAQHSVLVADLLRPELALWGLLHDASEAYLHDLTRPLKESLPAYRKVERAMMAAICERFGLPREMPGAVRHADNVALATEFRDLYGEFAPHCSVWAHGAQPLDATITPVCPEVAKDLFLVRYERLSGRAA